MDTPITADQVDKLKESNKNQETLKRCHEILDLAANMGHGSITFFFADPGVVKEKPRWNYVFAIKKDDPVVNMLKEHSTISSFIDGEKELGEPFSSNIKEVDDLQPEI